MMNRVHEHRRPFCRGVTLLELMVAIAVSGLIVTIVYTSWAFISRHTASNKKQTQFRVETENAARRILSQIRRSSRVLYFDETSVAFITPSSGDTGRYVYDGETLLYNGDSLSFLSADIFVTDFLVEKEEEDDLTATSDILLKVYFRFEDNRGNESIFELQTMAHYSQEVADEFNMGFW
ncbi:MAG: prepilin-type N-terminal cleavage/methylation domain-containing protein [Chitinivibrionales bacterium]|nr:prepilin-type N-terminal cleavage/methylation domain-containing protein [Chitinivibrionales bacterium]